MKSALIRISWVLVAVLGFSAVIQAQTESQAQQQPQQPQQQPQTQSQNRNLSPYKAMVFDVKYRDPQALADALQPLQSGGSMTSMVANRQMKTITVRDYPENITAIGEALKRLDVPDTTAFRPKPPESIEFQLHLIAASATAAAGDKAAFPAGLEPVVTQLKSTLKFGNYRYLTTFSNRVNEMGQIEATGVISPPFATASNVQMGKSGYNYSIRQPQSSTDASGKAVILINNFSFSIDVPVDIPGGSVQYRAVKLGTQLTLRDGETAVVGTANAGSTDEAIIVVISAKKMK